MTVSKLPKSITAAWPAAAIGLAALAVYGNCLHAPFVFDDHLAIQGNRTIHGLASALHPPAGGATVSGRPLLNLSFALNYAWGGLDTAGYHGVNLAIHVAAALVLLGVLRRTFARLPGVFSGPLSPEIAAFTAALLWTVHPLQTESVTYLSQRAESLSGLFYLLTMYAFIRGADADGRPGEAAPGLRSTLPWHALAALSCLLGVLTKETVVSAPVILLLYDRTFLAGSVTGALRRRRWSYAALVASWIPLACLVAAGRGRGGTSGFETGIPWSQYAVTQFPALLRYLSLAVWPHPLILDYGTQWVARPWAVLPQALAVASLLAGACFAALSRRAELRALGFAGLWFFALLAPTSLVPGARQTMAEHRMYLALAPIVAIGVAGAARLARRAAKPAALAVWMAAAAAAAAVLGSLTVLRNRDYRNERDLWAAVVARVPDNPFAQCNYGAALYQAGDLAGALARFGTAVRIDPDYAEAQNNFATALSRVPGKLTEAIAHYERAVSLNPDYADAQNNLAIALAKIPGRQAEAIAHWQRALRTDPTFADARCNLAALLSGIPGREPDASAQYAIALRIDPGDPRARAGLALIYFNRAKALDGIAGRGGEAIEDYRRALILAPNFAEAHYNLALELAGIPGKDKEVISHYEAALRIKPDFEDAHNNLAIAYAKAGRIAEAIEQEKAALKLDPGDAVARRNLAALERPPSR